MRANRFLYGALFFLLGFGAAWAVELTGSTFVNVTSDTAALAKSKAFNSAQREIVARTLRNYANPEQLNAAIKDTSNEELLNIISSSSVDGEKVSDTTYSAKVSVVLDVDAARGWLDSKSVQHWLPAAGAVMIAENSVVFSAVLLRTMSDWADLNAVARNAGVDLAVTKIVGNNVSFALNRQDSEKLVNALRSAGWRAMMGVGGFVIRR